MLKLICKKEYELQHDIFFSLLNQVIDKKNTKMVKGQDNI